MNGSLSICMYTWTTGGFRMEPIVDVSSNFNSTDFVFTCWIVWDERRLARWMSKKRLTLSKHQSPITDHRSRPPLNRRQRTTTITSTANTWHSTSTLRWNETLEPQGLFCYPFATPLRLFVATRMARAYSIAVAPRIREHLWNSKYLPDDSSHVYVDVSLSHVLVVERTKETTLCGFVAIDEGRAFTWLRVRYTVRSWTNAHYHNHSRQVGNSIHIYIFLRAIF